MSRKFIPQIIYKNLSGSEYKIQIAPNKQPGSILTDCVIPSKKNYNCNSFGAKI